MELVKFKPKEGAPILKHINTLVSLAKQHNEPAVREYLNKRVPHQLKRQVAQEADKILDEYNRV